jgi:hypothetical protein
MPAPAPRWSFTRPSDALWITDRTGQTSLGMLRTYERDVRHWRELGEAPVEADRAIPEIAAAFAAANAVAKPGTGGGIPTATTEKCTGRDLNPYASRRRNLNPLRLPISPPVRGASHGDRSSTPGRRAPRARVSQPSPPFPCAGTDRVVPLLPLGDAPGAPARVVRITPPASGASAESRRRRLGLPLNHAAGAWGIGRMRCPPPPWRFARRTVPRQLWMGFSSPLG